MLSIFVPDKFTRLYFVGITWADTSANLMGIATMF